MSAKVTILLFALFFMSWFSHAGGSETITVNAAFNGREIKVRVGALIRVELEELGAAGYVWEIKDLDKDHFEIVSAGAVEPPEKTDCVGGPVKKTFLLRAIARGKSRLTFVHYRPWEGEENASDNFRLKVRIL